LFKRSSVICLVHIAKFYVPVTILPNTRN